MEAGEDQTNSSSANSSAASGGNSRPPQIAQMSLYERQAVQVGHKATAKFTNSQIEVSFKSLIHASATLCLELWEMQLSVLLNMFPGTAGVTEAAQCSSVLPATDAAAADQQRSTP